MTQPAEPQPTPGATPPPAPQPTPPAPTVEPDKPLGPAGEKALAEERAARKELEKQVAALAPLSKLAAALGIEPGKTGKTDVEALAERLSAQEKELASERGLRLRLEVAQEKGLTAAQAARLNGTTKEELAADADALKQLFPAGATPPDPNAGAPGATPGEPNKPKTPGPDPSQGAKGTPASTRPTSLTAAIRAAITPKT
jgi:hypothetical protein